MSARGVIWADNADVFGTTAMRWSFFVVHMNTIISIEIHHANKNSAGMETEYGK